jgi:hypothetical protein
MEGLEQLCGMLREAMKMEKLLNEQEVCDYSLLGLVS